MEKREKEETNTTESHGNYVQTEAIVMSHSGFMNIPYGRSAMILEKPISKKISFEIQRTICFILIHEAIVKDPIEISTLLVITVCLVSVHYS